MVALIEFVFMVVGGLLQAIVFIIFAWAIVSWLVLFGVINTRNQTARTIIDLLDRIALPIIRPIQRVIPPLGTIDISPVLLMIVIWAAQQTLLPALEGWLISLVSPAAPGL